MVHMGVRGQRRRQELFIHMGVWGQHRRQELLIHKGLWKQRRRQELLIHMGVWGQHRRQELLIHKGVWEQRRRQELVHQGAWEEGCRWKVVENAQRRLSVEKAMARRRAEANEGKGTEKAIRTEGMDGRWDAKIASVHMGLASRNREFALVKRRFA